MASADISNAGNEPNGGADVWGRNERGRGTGSGLEGVKSAVADKLRNAASALQDKLGSSSGNSSQAGEGGASRYGQQAADLLGRSADYVERFDPQQVRSDIEDQVRRNPGRSLLIAGAAGLILGALIRRR